jgi:hypothetical protein
VTGVHVVTDPLTAAATATFLPGMADRLDPDDPADKLILARMAAFSKNGSGYLAIQNSRPQTIGYGLADSPLLQLAWIAEKVHEWTDLPADRDQLLTTVSPYWFTGCGASAAHTPTTRPTPPTGARRRPCRKASRSSARADHPFGAAPTASGRPRQARRTADIASSATAGRHRT